MNEKVIKVNRKKILYDEFLEKTNEYSIDFFLNRLIKKNSNKIEYIYDKKFNFDYWKNIVSYCFDNKTELKVCFISHYKSDLDQSMMQYYLSTFLKNFFKDKFVYINKKQISSMIPFSEEQYLELKNRYDIIIVFDTLISDKLLINHLGMDLLYVDHHKENYNDHFQNTISILKDYTNIFVPKQLCYLVDNSMIDNILLETVYNYRFILKGKFSKYSYIHMKATKNELLYPITENLYNRYKKEIRNYIIRNFSNIIYSKLSEVEEGKYFSNSNIVRSYDAHRFMYGNLDNFYFSVSVRMNNKKDKEKSVFIIVLNKEKYSNYYKTTWFKRLKEKIPTLYEFHPNEKIVFISPITKKNSRDMNGCLFFDIWQNTCQHIYRYFKLGKNIRNYQKKLYGLIVSGNNLEMNKLFNFTKKDNNVLSYRLYYHLLFIIEDEKKYNEYLDRILNNKDLEIVFNKEFQKK